MGMLKEFRDFALKGNVVELAVAVIIGGAFGSIVSSLVGDVITPLLLAPALEAANVKDLERLSWGAVKYGVFLSAILNFIIIAFILFFLLKAIRKLNQKNPEAPAKPTASEQLLMEIRDALKTRS
jgi:large conductance mechanosensitive channel